MEIGNANIMIFIFGIILHSCPAFDRVQTAESTAFEIFFGEGWLLTRCCSLFIYLFILLFNFCLFAFLILLVRISSEAN